MTEIRFSNGKNVIEKWDRVFSVICAEPRRQLIVSLMDASPDESVSLPESAVNPNVPVDAETLRNKLYHVHLPQLAEHGYVTYQTDPLRASRGPKFDHVATVFEALHAHARADALPDQLVVGCQRLEREREYASTSASTAETN